MILTYHVTEQSWGKPKLEICWQGKDRREKKKKDREGQSEWEEIKRERGKDKRHLGTEVERKKELQDLKPTLQFSIFVSFLFPQRRFLPCHFIDRRAVTGSFPRS